MTATKSKPQLAREAGARGKKTAPLTAEERIDNYRRQNWERSGHTMQDLTARQRRQIDRMCDRALLARHAGEQVSGA